MLNKCNIYISVVKSARNSLALLTADYTDDGQSNKWPPLFDLNPSAGDIWQQCNKTSQYTIFF